MTHIDKNSIKHFFVGFLPSAVGGLYGVSFATGAGLTREYDNSHKKGNHFCWWDLLFDFLGMSCGQAVHLLIFKSWNF